MSDPRRLLQVLADTEASPQNRSALELHRLLAANGWAVRTLALAPGKRSDLAATIPVMAPVRRSFATVGQFRTEQAWADLVLLQGIRTAGIARVAGSTPPRVLALWDEPSRWSERSRIPRCDSYLLGSVDALVVNTEDDASRLAVQVGPFPEVFVTGAVAVAPPEFVSGRWLECLSSALPSRP